MDKKGIVRILEAVFAVLLIAGAVAVIVVQNNQVSNEEETIKQIQQIILEEISASNELREAVLLEDIPKLNDTIKDLVPIEYVYEFKVCDLDEICRLPQEASFYTDGDIYADEVSVSSTLDIPPDNPKRLRLFMWERV